MYKSHQNKINDDAHNFVLHHQLLKLHVRQHSPHKCATRSNLVIVKQMSGSLPPTHIYCDFFLIRFQLFTDTNSKLLANSMLLLQCWELPHQHWGLREHMWTYWYDLVIMGIGNYTYPTEVLHTERNFPSYLESVSFKSNF